MRQILEYVKDASSIDEYLLSKDNPIANSVGFDIERIKMNDIEGGSFHDDVILTTANELTKLLGKPEKGFDKSKYNWGCKYENIEFYIYDYREPHFTKDTEIEFHIGTEEPEDSETVMNHLKEIGLNAYHKKYPWQK